MPTKKVQPKKKAKSTAKKSVANKRLLTKPTSHSSHLLQPPPFTQLPTLPRLDGEIFEEIQLMRIEQRRLMQEQILFTMAATLWIMALTFTVSKISRRISYL